MDGYIFTHYFAEIKEDLKKREDIFFSLSSLSSIQKTDLSVKALGLLNGNYAKSLKKVILMA